MKGEHSICWRRATWGTLLLLALVRVQAQLPVIPEDVQTTVRQRVDYGYCPGIVVGLMNTNGSTYFSYGRMDLDGGPAVDENTLFEIGSIGKVFTTTLLADMAQRGELELTNAIQSYLTLRHYVGRYEGDGGDSFTIGLRRGHLTLEYEYRPDLFRTFTLHPSSANRFYLTFPEGSATFLTNDAGHATDLVWSQDGTTFSCPKVRVPSSLTLRRVNGVVQLDLSGDTDRDYVVQASTDLSHWVDLSTNTIWDGPIMDPKSAAFPHRFYRVLEP